MSTYYVPGTVLSCFKHMNPFIAGNNPMMQVLLLPYLIDEETEHREIK